MQLAVALIKTATLSRLRCATAAATLGVVTTMRKLNKKLQKLNKAPLNPTAASGPEPSRPTRAVQHMSCVRSKMSRCNKPGLSRMLLLHYPPVSTSDNNGSNIIEPSAGIASPKISASYWDFSQVDFSRPDSGTLTLSACPDGPDNAISPAARV